MRIAVIGTGHVALVTGAGFAEFGNDVVVVGFDEGEVAKIAEGDLGVFEPGLGELLRANLDGGRVRFTTDLEEAVRSSEVIFLVIPVDPDASGQADLGQLFAVADRVGKALDAYKVIAVRSTVPVGTVDRLGVRIGAHGSAPFAVAYNPAFIKEGDAIADFMKPDRVVIGTSDARAAELLRRLYAPFVRTQDRIFAVDTKSAELAKHASSAILAVRISFMNEMSQLADELGADIEVVRRIVGADPRIGPHSLFVGPGYGGTRFHRDIAQLLHTAREVGRELSIVKAATDANERQQQVLVRKLQRGLGDLEGKMVAVWGLAFKPRTHDIGHAPAIALIEGLLSRGCAVKAHDPRAAARARKVLGDRVQFPDDMYDAVDGADALVLVTEWHQYRRPDFTRIAQKMRGKLVIDGRNIWEPVELREFGLRYLGVGRG
jgi:UDPglucose 6-dehydrogenase